MVQKVSSLAHGNQFDKLRGSLTKDLTQTVAYQFDKPKVMG